MQFNKLTEYFVLVELWFFLVGHLQPGICLSGEVIEFGQNPTPTLLWIEQNVLWNRQGRYNELCVWDGETQVHLTLARLMDFSQSPKATGAELCPDLSLPRLNFSSHHSCFNLSKNQCLSLSQYAYSVERQEDILLEARMVQYHSHMVLWHYLAPWAAMQP